MSLITRHKKNLAAFLFLFILGGGISISVNNVFAAELPLNTANSQDTVTPVEGGGGLVISMTKPVPTTPQDIVFKNPLKYETVEGVLGSVLKAIQSIIAVLAMVFIVIGGILYITSAGNQQRTELAKNAIWAAVIGLALAIAAPSFLKEIYKVLGADAPEESAEALDKAKTLTEIAMNVLSVLLGFIGALSVLMLVVGGILYITSAGDDTRTDMAKKTIKYAVIGLLVAMISLVIVTQIAKVITGA